MFSFGSGVNPFTAKYDQRQIRQKSQISFCKFLKQITPHESTSKEISFEWSHHRILSTDVKVRTTSQTPSSTLAVKGLKKDWGMGFSVLAAREMKREPKNERGGRGRKETFPFFPNPSPLFYLRHFWRGLWLSFSFFNPKPQGNACYAG